MKVYKSIEEIDRTEPCSIALGTFDGVHPGHRLVIGHAVESAKERGIKSAVFTFSTESRLQKKKNAEGKQAKGLISEDEKLRIFSELGVGYVFDLPFEESISLLSPREFTEKLLIGKFNMRECFCGFNYRFGFKAEGDVEMLSGLGRELGFDVNVLSELKIENETVSSTLIRELVSEGKLEEAAKFLGTPYSYSGIVVHGDGNGSSFGYATCNLVPLEELCLPKEGVYAGECRLPDGKKRACMINLGSKPTLGKEERLIEVHILDYEGDLYGKTITVFFYKRLRDIVRFSNVGQLKERLIKDEAEVRSYFKGR